MWLILEDSSPELSVLEEEPVQAQGEGAEYAEDGEQEPVQEPASGQHQEGDRAGHGPGPAGELEVGGEDWAAGQTERGVGGQMISGAGENND